MSNPHRPHLTEDNLPATHSRHDHGHPLDHPAQPDPNPAGSGGNPRHDTPGARGPYEPHPIPDALDE